MIANSEQIDRHVPVPAFLTGVHKCQAMVLQQFDRWKKAESLARFYMLVWHRRARKTTLALNLLIRECKEHANRVYLYVGPTYKQAKAIIWRDPWMLNRYLPDQRVFGWKKNESELLVTFQNGSILQIKGGDDPDSIRGIDAAGVVFDEFALCKPEIWTEIFLPILRKDPSKWAMFIFTPKGENHAAMLFREAADRPDWFTHVLDSETSRLYPPAELAAAKREMPRSLFDQELMCRFITDEEMSLITSAQLDALQRVERAYPECRRIISCDPASGGDEAVAYAMVNDAVIDSKIMHDRDTMKLVGELMLMGREHGIHDYIIDTIGVGKGVGDRLSELEMDVQHFNSASEAAEKDRYINKRAEVWWKLSTRVRDLQVPYPDDMELRRQVSAVKYRISSSGKLALEPKEKTKKTLGNSPDRADAWVMGLYGLENVEPDKGLGKQIDDFRRPGRLKNRQYSMAGAMDAMAV